MIQVYTGNGRGKTVAALGLCLRAVGAGKKVCVIQFLKKGGYSELKALKKLGNVKVEQYGSGKFIRNKPGKTDISLAKKGIDRAKKIVLSGKYPLVVLDEVNPLMSLGIVDIEGLVKVLKSAPRGTEIVLTGRGLHRKVKDAAHLVSEVKEIKHYFKAGVKARKGFEY